MMPTEGFERQLPVTLHELAEPRTPDYLDDLLWQTARTSQRPAWSFLERWLPMLDIVRQPVAAPPIPWRSIGLAFALLALLLAMVAALAVGGLPKAPAPFGPASNGLVAYASEGDIFTADPVTGAATAIVAGPTTDLNPRWSLDGTRLAFERKTNGNIGRGLVFVAQADGSNPILVTPEALPGIDSYHFSPNGEELLISASPDRTPGILVAATDGSGIRQLDLPGPATNAAWRPPTGDEIVFMDTGGDTLGFGGLHVVDVSSGEVRTVLAEDPVLHRQVAGWSPDGSHIAYIQWIDSSDFTAQIHIMAADGSGDRVLPMPDDAMWQMAHSWSNDGTRLVAVRGYTGDFAGSVAVALPVDGSGYGVEFDTSRANALDCCTAWEWAPDGKAILGMPTGETGQPFDPVILDPLTGTSTTVPWRTTSYPAWQRVAK